VFVGEEMVNGKQVLFVEQQFLMIDAQSVTQITIQKVMWEEFVKQPTVPLEFANTRLAQQNAKDDKHVFVPRLPHHHHHHSEDGRMIDHDNHHGHHHGYHHHGYHHDGYYRHHWWKNLSKPSKIAVVIGGLFIIMSIISAVSCVVKRRTMKKKTLVISAPIDDSVIVDVNEKKNGKDEEKFDFHFEMDNAVVVEDKKVLIEE